MLDRPVIRRDAAPGLVVVHIELFQDFNQLRILRDERTVQGLLDVGVSSPRLDARAYPEDH